MNTVKYSFDFTKFQIRQFQFFYVFKDIAGAIVLHLKVSSRKKGKPSSVGLRAPLSSLSALFLRFWSLVSQQNAFKEFGKNNFWDLVIKHALNIYVVCGFAVPMSGYCEIHHTARVSAACPAMNM